jgi:hypothetical protein
MEGRRIREYRWAQNSLAALAVDISLKMFFRRRKIHHCGSIWQSNYLFLSNCVPSSLVAHLIVVVCSSGSQKFVLKEVADFEYL